MIDFRWIREVSLGEYRALGCLSLAGPIVIGAGFLGWAVLGSFPDNSARWLVVELAIGLIAFPLLIASLLWLIRKMLE